MPVGEEYRVCGGLREFFAFDSGAVIMGGEDRPRSVQAKKPPLSGQDSSIAMDAPKYTGLKGLTGGPCPKRKSCVGCPPTRPDQVRQTCSGFPSAVSAAEPAALDGTKYSPDPQGAAAIFERLTGGFESSGTKKSGARS